MEPTPAIATPAGLVPTSLAAQLRRHLPTFLHGSIYLLAFNGLRAGIDLFLKRGVDDFERQRFGATSQIGLWLVLLTACAVVVRVRSRVILFNAGRDIEYELRGALLAKLHTLGPAFFRKMPVGEVMSRTTNDLAQVRLLFGFGALNVVNTVFAYVSALAIMIGVSPRLTVASLVVYPPLLLIVRAFSRSVFKRTRENQDALGKMSEQVQSNFAGVRVIRSFALEDAEERDFGRVNDAYLEKGLALARLRGSLGPIMAMLSTLGVFVVFWYGGRLIVADRLSPGAFVAFLSALARLAWPTIALGFMLSIVQRGRASFARLEEVFREVPEVVSGNLAAPARVSGALEVRHLSFDYGDYRKHPGAPEAAARRVLHDVSFEVQPGRSLAIVGRTGAGKTTLASLLPRLLPTPRGTILLDGVDVCDLPLESVRRAIGYAQQDSFLFSTTVGRNVGFSLEDPDNEESVRLEERALEEAFVLDEVRRFVDGVETIVGERGVQLSGGQRQRVALARALLREPPIIVLDDPLSAVDAKTEAAILESIERQQRARTVLLITHRVAAASRCDSIVVLDAGRVIERGTHAELVAAGGLYAAFAAEQEVAAQLEDLEKLDEIPPSSQRVPAAATSPHTEDPAEGCA